MRNVETYTTPLMAGYQNVMVASGETTIRDLSVEKERTRGEISVNPLGVVFELLANFLVTPSAESVDLARSKSRESAPRKGGGSPRKKAKVSKEDIDEVLHFEEQSPEPERESR